MATGAYPQLHGIVAEGWYDRETRAVIRANPDALMATTLAAQFAPRAGGRVFAVALEQERAALLAAGSGARVFSMNSAGDFSSTGEDPTWVAEYRRLHPLENLRGAKWMAVGAGPSTPPLRSLNYDPAHPDEFLRLFRASPYGAAALLDFVRELVREERLGQSSSPDLLLIASGSTELLGYDTGAESPLMDQMVLMLDGQIEALLEALDKAAGPANYALVVAGAHGAPRDPGDRRPQLAVPGDVLARAINRDVPVSKYVYPFLYLKDPSREARVQAGRAALRTRWVAGYYTSDGACSHTGEWAERFGNSFHAERSGDVMLSYRPDCVEDYGAGRGISYGSLYQYDSRVPLFLFGPAFVTGTYERRAETVDIVPTLARVAGVGLPSSATGRVLDEALSENSGPPR